MMVDEKMKKVLQLWQSYGEFCENELEAEPVPGDHLGEQELYQLAGKGGLENASEAAVEHLSRCRRCRESWEAWLETQAILAADDDAEEDDRHLAAGFLWAASSSLWREPVSLPSSCGRFELCLYPELDHPSRGMVVLEVREGSMEGEPGYCVVRDGTGAVILQGTPEDGRLAGRVEELSLLDLKTWTVVADGRGR